MRLRVSRAQAPGSRKGAGADVAEAPSEEPSSARRGRALSLRLLERMVLDRLHGEMEAAPDGAWIEIRLPQAALSIGETVSFSPSRLRVEALRTLRPEPLGGEA